MTTIADVEANAVIVNARAAAVNAHALNIGALAFSGLYTPQVFSTHDALIAADYADGGIAGAGTLATSATANIVTSASISEGKNKFYLALRV